MTAPAEITRALRNALARADLERRRAERTAEIAERHEQQMLTDPPLLREFHLRMANTHRQVQRQHLAAATMHSSHADRLRIWVDTRERHRALPRFMASVAEAAEADSAAVTVFGPGLIETLTAVSDDTAKAAQDAEFTLGEGPAREAMTSRRAVRATGIAVRRRWPNYGPAVERLGIRSIAAVPMGLTGVPLGALTLFGLHPRPDNDDLDGLRAIADTVATMLLPEGERNGAGDDANPCSLLAEVDHRAVIHQATGVVSVEYGCATPDALALIRARAFAEDRPIEDIASDIVDRKLRLA
jgi:hypothetical protein